MERPGWRGEDTSLRFTQKQNAAVRHRETRERASDNVFVSIVLYSPQLGLGGSCGKPLEVDRGSERQGAGGRERHTSLLRTLNIQRKPLRSDVQPN